MEPVYTVVRDENGKSKSCGKVTCAWSCRNLVATAGCKLAQCEEYQINEIPEQKAQSTGSELNIHIIDPDCPWEVCSINSGHEDTIQDILWDATGSRLLSVDRRGQCKVWAMKDNLINDWQCVANTDVGEGEKIVCVSWLDTGMKYMFRPSDDKSFAEKYPRMQCKPPYVHFGGRSRDGWVAVTETGLVCVTTTPKPNPHMERACLGVSRTQVSVADLAFASNGEVLVAVNDGCKNSIVQVYRVTITSTASNSCHINSAPLPSLAPHQQQVDFSDYVVTVIQFVSKCVAFGESLIICTEGSFGCCIRCWELKKEHVDLHEKFQKTFISQVPNTVTWKCVASYVDSAKVVCLTLPRLYMPPGLNRENSSYPLSGLVASYNDGKIQVFNSHTLAVWGTYHSSQLNKDKDLMPATKKPRSSFKEDVVCSMQLSPCCCCLLGVTGAGNLIVFKVQTPGESGSARVVRKLVDLLEYCLLTGWEYWDVLVAANMTSPDIVENVLQLLTEEFSNQHSTQQQLYLTRFTSMKASLLRCCKDGYGQMVDCFSFQLIHSIGTAFKSLIPYAAEQLTGALMNSPDADADRIVKSLETKDFELDKVTLLSLQPLIQFVADFSVFLTTIIPAQKGRDKQHGGSLLHDTQSLSLLREMLILIKIWGHSNQACLPAFSKPVADKLEMVSLLFKLLTILWRASIQSGDEYDIEESLSSQAEVSAIFPHHISPLEEYQNRCFAGVVGRSLSVNPTPAVYQFGCDTKWPGSLLGRASRGVNESLMKYDMDVVRRICIEYSPNRKLRKCSRCNCVSLVTGLTQSTATKAWDQRWVKSCVCGGLWKLCKQPTP